MPQSSGLRPKQMKRNRSSSGATYAIERLARVLAGTRERPPKGARSASNGNRNTGRGQRRPRGLESAPGARKSVSSPARRRLNAVTHGPPSPSRSLLVLLLEIPLLACASKGPAPGSREFQNPSHEPRTFGSVGRALTYVVMGDSTAAGRGGDYGKGIAVSTAGSSPGRAAFRSSTWEFRARGRGMSRGFSSRPPSGCDPTSSCCRWAPTTSRTGLRFAP
jgi:hypothetical protein